MSNIIKLFINIVKNYETNVELGAILKYNAKY